MVIELHIKVYQVLNAQGQHWVPTGIATKSVLLSVPLAGLLLLFFPFTTLFSILTSSPLSYLSLVFCRRVNQVTSRHETTLCQDVVADSIHPPILYPPVNTQAF